MADVRIAPLALAQALVRDALSSRQIADG